MPLQTVAEYAQRIGRDRSWVRQLKKQGRLVLVGELIDAEASDARIAATAAGNAGVAERHERGREGRGDPSEAGLTGRFSTLRERKLAAEVQRAEAQAQRELMEFEQARGKLLHIDVVGPVLDDFATFCRVEIENQAMQLAPNLVGLSDLDEIERVIERFNREMLFRIAARCRAERKTIGAGHQDPT